jgi:hypothetical protein
VILTESHVADFGIAAHRTAFGLDQNLKHVVDIGWIGRDESWRACKGVDATRLSGSKSGSPRWPACAAPRRASGVGVFKLSPRLCCVPSGSRDQNTRRNDLLRSLNIGRTTLVVTDAK